MDHEKVNILLVDDQPAKLLAYEVILKDLGENLVIASSGREALEVLLKTEIAVILVDVCMPELDGFELAAMIREHPRFQKTAMIFISAIQVSDIDRLRGYEMGAVDYVPVPVVPEVLRAKIKVFAELYRKTRELERLNQELEDRVRARTAELENSTAKLRESEQRRSMAIAAGKMGSWDWDWISGDWMWDEGQYRIFGVNPESFEVNPANVQALLHPDDVDQLRKAIAEFNRGTRAYETEFRIMRPDSEVRWCVGTAAATVDDSGRVVRVSGVTVDITERKRAEERQNLLAREVDHRAKNALALAQSIVRLTRADEVKAYVNAVEGRINALARVHTILSLSSWQGAELSRLIDEELAPYSLGGQIILAGPEVQLLPTTAQTLALALHELFTNSAKYGALSTRSGRLTIGWQVEEQLLTLSWEESGGPLVMPPKSRGFGTRSLLASVESQLGGQARFDWRAEGLLCRLEVPLTRKTGATAPSGKFEDAGSAELQRASG
ncbi:MULTISPECIES: HWE histidine kinase domain-containing protein [unclassified Bradyrhizobium]|uniref:HWE histidine kinase domain-containing protein n=1 Tax=unclassified Bradyrhizobium TaxID=2631580 RepID=UPI00211E6345|nr:MULTISPECIES: HWE histidine kinase domain-containing protein [unclassified Bradyrhizobium]MDD1536160.1 two-component system response regulator protein-glutamate methylesterase [Bradyrhizobium sp. WBOS8]MDD1585920.1 two-component system response regulator protein-glutamate methylesterase [Bradyrhizobium sp. WBOS4]UUO47704.1 two-component system response regulator protein-glutamate methylesterase [Bradyrhizobium sp. WBOS04]UUO61322.1 two-component system response regulator protein-glutamate me